MKQSGCIIQRQEQTLSLSPQMRQSLAMLQMNSEELYEYLIGQAMENPVIVMEEIEAAQSRRLTPLCSSFGEFKTDPAALAVAAQEFIFDRLKQDFSVMSKDMAVTRVGQSLIDRLDKNGYLKKRELYDMLQSGIPQKTLKQAFHLLRQLQPAGIGARDLRECLLLQLRDRGYYPSDAWLIVSKYLPLLGRNQLQALSQKTGLPMGRVLAACEIIRSLQPRPLAAESVPDADFIVPDIRVFRSGDRLEVELNQISADSIRLDESYKSRDHDAKTGSYLDARYKSALWIRCCIRRRCQTLARCAETLVRIQARFFFEGPCALVPYTQKHMANSLGLHKSTISRALKNKYIACEFGTFKMDYFFPQPLLSRDSTVLCSDALSAIGHIIAEENGQRPLSDAQITEKLSEYGITISRRTVAKYRQKLCIPSSLIRRSFEK